MDSRSLSSTEFLQMLKAADEDEALPIAEAQVMELQNLEQRYGNHSFKRGDLVTPMKSGTLGRYSDRPAIILEVIESPVRHLQGSPGSTLFGAVFDIRVGIFCDGNYLALMAESHCFERYQGVTP